MRVLVTGGTGYLGSAIVRSLARRGHEAIVFSRRASSSGLPGTHVNGDVRDVAALSAAAAGADAICHTAALVRIWSPRHDEFETINVGGLQAAIEACRSRGIPRLVYTSSFLALPPADGAAPLAANDYQRTKVRAREVAQAAAARGVPIISLYPGVIYGPGPESEANLVGRLVRDHLAGRLPGLIGADRCWSYAYLEDVAEAHVTALERAPSSAEYIVGGVNAPQMRVFEIVHELTGSPLPRRIPFAIAEAVGWLEELRAHVTNRPPLLTRGVVKIFRRDWSLDSARSIGELDYRIRPLEEGLALTLAALRP